jgi:tRNA(fMet)-specific endonuclease VapC
MKYLLDTNSCIAAMRHHPQVLRRMQGVSPNDCGVSTVTTYELYSGVERCRTPELEARKVAVFLGPLHELPFDHEAARHTARIRWLLEQCGRPIGPYDLMLAGQALALDVTLVSNNTREFSRVPGLRLEDWQQSTG